MKNQKSFNLGNNKFKEEEELQKLENQIKAEKLNSLLITTGYNFETYKIIKYKTVITASVVVGTGLLSELSADISDILGIEATSFTCKLDLAKQAAQSKLAEVALHENANAIIGIDYEIFSIGSNMIAVSISGTAVNVTPLSES